MKIKSLITFLLMMAVLAGCTFMNNSSSISSGEDIVQGFMVSVEKPNESSSTRAEASFFDSVTGNVTLNWFSNDYYAQWSITRTVLDDEGNIESLQNTVEMSSSLDATGNYVYEWVDTAGITKSNVIVTYTLDMAGANTNLATNTGNTTSFALIGSADDLAAGLDEVDVRLTLQKSSAEFTGNLYNTSNYPFTGSETNMTITTAVTGDTTGAYPILLSNMDAVGTTAETTLDVNTAFMLGAHIDVTDGQVDTWLLEEELKGIGYMQFSNSFNCKIETAAISDPSEVTAAFTFNYEDLPLLSARCDQDYDDIVVLVEVLK